MQQMETTPAADALSEPEGTAYRGAFVYVGNLARVREAFGPRCASEFSAQIARRLGAFTCDPARQIAQVGDDCLVLWLPQDGEAAEDILEQLMVQAGSRPMRIDGRDFVPALHAGWTELQTDAPRPLSADESSYVLYASASHSTLCAAMWRGHADRFQADMEIAAGIARAHADERIECEWQGVISPYSPVNVLYWRGVARPSSQAAEVHLASPEVFMPSLERLGLTRVLDRAQALQVFGRLLRDPSLRLACRISSMSVQKDHYWSQLLALLAAHPAAAGRFTLEISGRTALPSLDEARDFCTAVRERGARIAMAGFGSGPINLEGLQACNPHTLLLDDSFVLRGRHNPDARRALRDMIRICSHLAEQIVVAGVENEQDYSNALRAGARWMCGRFVNGASFDPAKAFAQKAEDKWISAASPARAAAARRGARTEPAFHAAPAIVAWGFAG